MIKSIYTVTISVWDYFTGHKERRLEYETLLEAFTQYKSYHADDCDLGDHFILPEGELTFEDFSDVKNVVPTPEPKEEYVFDKDDYVF